MHKSHNGGKIISEVAFLFPCITYAPTKVVWRPSDNQNRYFMKALLSEMTTSLVAWMPNGFDFAKFCGLLRIYELYEILLIHLCLHFSTSRENKGT